MGPSEDLSPFSVVSVYLRALRVRRWQQRGKTVAGAAPRAILIPPRPSRRVRFGIAGALVLLALACMHVVASVPLVARLDGGAAWLNVALLLVEVVLVGFAALLVASLRRARLPPTGEGARGHVDVLIPVRNEDARVLSATLAAARAMRDPGDGFSLVVADDSDPVRAAEVARVCDAWGVARVARASRVGFKAGALNAAMAQSRAPFVAVLDVDHEPSPDFLVSALARFAPGVAFVQTQLAWRNADSLLRRLAALLQHQFYHGVQMEKASRERAVFSGSGAVFRREALESVGGFPEETLVEDFDLTMRLTAAGWRARLAPVVGARGLLPWSARDLARQLWRWSHGTTEAIRLRWRDMLRARGAPLWPRVELLLDGCAYLAGGAIVAAAILLVAAGAAGVPIVRPLGGWSLLLAPLAVALAHVGSAALALRASGERGFALLPLYHVVSLAFTPVLFASSLTALAGRGRGFEGRVTKAAGQPQRRGLRAAVAVATLLGVVGVLAASLGDLPLPAAGWVGFLGLSFVATVATAWPASASGAPSEPAP